MGCGLKRSMMVFCKAELSAAFASAVDFALTVVLAEFANLWYVYATSAGAIVGGAVNCCINCRWVFAAGHLGKAGMAVRYMLVWIGSIVLNTGVTWLVTELTGINYIVSKTMVACAVAVLWNYRMQRDYVFRYVDEG